MLGAVCVAAHTRNRWPVAEPPIFDTAMISSPGDSGERLLVISGGTSTVDSFVPVTLSLRTVSVLRLACASPAGRRAAAAAASAAAAMSVSLRVVMPGSFRQPRAFDIGRVGDSASVARPIFAA